MSAGGHSSNTGASNIEAGVTIDLSRLAKISLTDDGGAVWLGPAARWSDVYSVLEPNGLTVAGGRAGHVGVGGLVLGGGLSWFANQYGWSCDSVLEFEIVTSDLRIVRASESSHPDLFWALKGSLGAFGIVTAIKMRTIPTSGIYAGAISYREDVIFEVFSGLPKMALYADTDPYTSGYISCGYSAKYKEFSTTVYLVNTASHNDSMPIEYFRNIPHMYTSLRQTTISSSANEIAASNPLGLRRSKFTLTTGPTLEKIQPLHQLFREAVSTIALDPEGAIGISYQPLTLPHLRNQNNIFKETLTIELMPLLLVSIEVWWEDAARDEYFETFMKALEKEMTGYRGCMWACHTWLYPNYAAGWQNPMEEWRLGKWTWERLESVKAEYDPIGIWKRLRSGIWHI